MGGMITHNWSGSLQYRKIWQAEIFQEVDMMALVAVVGATNTNAKSQVVIAKKCEKKAKHD